MCCWLEKKKPKSINHFPFSTTSLTAQATAIGKADGGSGDQENISRDISVVLGYALQVKVDGQHHGVYRRKKNFSLCKGMCFIPAYHIGKEQRESWLQPLSQKREIGSIRDMYSAECP